MKKCYIYTRVSTAAQTEGYSLEAQQESLRGYAEYRELKIAGEYCDARKSGKSIKGRLAFRKMMDDVISQKDDIAYLLVFKLSCFGRNATDILKSLQLLEDYGVDLVSVNEGIDSSTQGGRLTLAILSAVAEMEHENITVQFMSGKLQKIMEGGWSGGPVPYGYRSADGRLVQDDEEAATVRKIFDLYLQEGVGATSVVKYLNDNGYFRTGNNLEKPSAFNSRFICRVLDNAFYCGRIVYNRRSNKKDRNGNPILQESDKVISVRGEHEPIIVEEIWEKAQKKRKSIAEACRKAGDTDHISVLSGLRQSNRRRLNQRQLIPSFCLISAKAEG